MFRHALVGVDFSKSWPTLQQRLERLREWGLARVTLVYIMSSRYPAVPEETHRSYYEQKLKELMNELHALGLELDWDIRNGEPGAELVAAARDHGADLLLIANQGYSRVREFFIGSTALDAARLTDRPLWLEPAVDEPPRTPGNPMLATDGSKAAESAQQTFTELVQKTGRGWAITAVEPIHSTETVRATMETHLGELSANTPGLQTRLIEGSPSEAIRETIQREGADLLVIGQRGRNPITQLLLGSVAEAACRGAEVPVLLVPTKHD